MHLMVSFQASTVRTMRSRWTALALLAAGLSLGGCGGGAVLTSPVSPTLEFVDAPAVAVVLALDDGRQVELYALNGRRLRELSSGPYPIGIADFSDRLDRAVGRSAETAFRQVIGEPRSSLALPVSWHMNLALDGPGDRIGASSMAAKQFVVFAFATGNALVERSCPNDEPCSFVGFDRHDPDVVWLTAGAANRYLRFTLSSGAWTWVDPSDATTVRWPATYWRRNGTRCAETGEELVSTESAVDVRSRDGRVRRLVATRGFRQPLLLGDAIRPIGGASFVPGCAYAVFQFYSEDYVVDVRTGQIGRLPGRIVTLTTTPGEDAR
jgi:hypothetical protein